MSIQELINALQNAITVHHYDPETPVQIDMLCEEGEMIVDTYWNISVDASAVSEPRSLAINVETLDERAYCEGCDTILNYNEGDICCWCEQRAKDEDRGA